MSTIYLIHGFNVKDGGKSTTGSLRKPLEALGHTVKEVRYGWMGRVRVRLCNTSVARVLADMADDDSIVIAHSNGCAIAYKAALYGAPFKHAILINPALDADKEIPNVRKVTVCYAPSDPWTRLARFIPLSDWGRQGQIGFTGQAVHGKYWQYNLDKVCGTEVHHSGAFDHHAKLLTLITGVIR